MLIFLLLSPYEIFGPFLRQNFKPKFNFLHRNLESVSELSGTCYNSGWNGTPKVVNNSTKLIVFRIKLASGVGAAGIARPVMTR